LAFSMNGQKVRWIGRNANMAAWVARFRPVMYAASWTVYHGGPKRHLDQEEIDKAGRTGHGFFLFLGRTASFPGRESAGSGSSIIL
jgi:hypothetical protein